MGKQVENEWEFDSLYLNKVWHDYCYKIEYKPIK